MRQWLIAVGYGFVAGVAATVVLKLMTFVTHLLWQGDESGWRIFVIIMAGGVLIALIRRFTKDYELELGQQVSDARDLLNVRHRLVLLVAATAVVSVGFGGALGPEAGILAVVTEISAIMSALLAQSAQERRLIGEAGVAGALSGLYGSPPGGAIVGDEGSRTPFSLLLGAGVAGLLGFLLSASVLLESGAFRVQLPAYSAAGDGTDLLRAIPPALLGAVTGLAFVFVLPALRALASKLGNATVQTLVGTFLFAALASVLPILRFSGHHEIETLLEFGKTSGMATLMGLAFLKVLALTICLVSGWRGGAIFPLIFAGAAAGGAALWLMPGTSVTLALIAGISSAVTIGFGKPAAAALIIIFMVAPFAGGPLCVGALIGYVASLIGPKPELH